MKFCIELSSELLSDIYSAKSKSIFQHEIYHCKDILVLYKNGIIDKKLLHSKIHTTYDYVLDLSLKEWSEFYAVYSTVKSNGWYETYTIDLDIESIANVIDEIHANSRKGFSMQLSKNMLCAIRSFIYDMVTMIGIYLVTGNFDIIRQYTESNEKFVADYFNLILNVLQTKLSKYPEWVNKEQFVALGRNFLNILTLNGILYSTDDLHDGLYFKCNI